MMPSMEPRCLLTARKYLESWEKLIVASMQTPSIVPDLLLDTYFARIHGKPYYILDETVTRQRMQANQLPRYLAYAIYAVCARYAEPSHDVGEIN